MADADNVKKLYAWYYPQDRVTTLTVKYLISGAIDAPLLQQLKERMERSIPEGYTRLSMGGLPKGVVLSSLAISRTDASKLELTLTVGVTQDPLAKDLLVGSLTDAGYTLDPSRIAH